MGNVRFALAAVCFLTVAAAQEIRGWQRQGLGQALLEVEYDLPWRDRYEVSPARVPGSRVPVAVEDRLLPVLRFLLAGRDKLSESGVGARVTSAAPKIWVLAVGDRMAIVEGVFRQLELEKPLQARLHATLLSLPATVAREHGLRPHEVTQTDEAAVRHLARATARHEGTLRNLPEILAAPLSPFAVAVPGNGDLPNESLLRVRGEMVPVRAAAVAVRVHLVRGALPTEPTCTPDSPLLQSFVCLEAGHTAIVMAEEGAVAQVLVVRCIDLTHAALPQTPRVVPAPR